MTTTTTTPTEEEYEKEEEEEYKGRGRRGGRGGGGAVLFKHLRGGEWTGQWLDLYFEKSPYFSPHFLSLTGSLREGPGGGGG